MALPGFNVLSNNTLLTISAGGIILISILSYFALSGDDYPSNRSLLQNSNMTKTPSFTPPKISSKDEAITELQEKVTALQEQITEEAKLRKSLALKLAYLERSIAGPPSEDNEKMDTGEDSEDISSSNPHQTSSSISDERAQWFNEQAMMEAGIDTSKINYIKSIFEQTEMEKLYLRDQATREGWMNTPRYQKAAKEIADKTKSLRNELTEEEYDAYLFASGRSNRIIVSSVLGNSPAANAGIKPGDTILKYGTDRVYNWTDLTTATSTGDTNNTVAVTIIRDGRQEVVYIPRGPMGVKLSTDSVAP